MKNILSIAFVFCILQMAVSQTLSPVIKLHDGIQNNRMFEIDNIMKDYVDKNQLVGAVVLVVKDNQVVYHKGHGY